MWLAATLALGGCSIASKQMTTATTEPKHIAIFFDGTNNDEESDTNVKRLHSLVTLQKRSDLATFYIEGVGSEMRVLGMGTGWGFQARVKPAYQFLLENYRPGDRIYIFGFSRGAYSARVLASLLYHAGLPKNGKLSTEEIAEIVFDEVKEPLSAEAESERASTTRSRLAAIDGMSLSEPVSVEVLGLWDTVEALGLPDWGARIKHKLGIEPYFIDVDIPNQRYGDQLCNVRNAYHALSIDDNREWIFTPLLLGRKSMLDRCPRDGQHMLGADGRIIPGRLKEVWFAGAHSDVGGGYQDSMMSGVTLNWMMEQIAATGLLPQGAAVNEDRFGRSHDPESGLFGLIYHNINRNIGSYLTDTRLHREEFANTMCVHPSVMERRRTVGLKEHENRWLTLRQPGKICLVKNTSEGISDPQRLMEREPSSTQPCDRELEVQVWPNCSGQQ